MFSLVNPPTCRRVVGVVVVESSLNRSKSKSSSFIRLSCYYISRSTSKSIEREIDRNRHRRRLKRKRYRNRNRKESPFPLIPPPSAPGGRRGVVAVRFFVCFFSLFLLIATFWSAMLQAFGRPNRLQVVSWPLFFAKAQYLKILPLPKAGARFWPKDDAQDGLRSS